MLLFGYCWFYVVKMRDGKETCKSETIERIKNILTTPNLSDVVYASFRNFRTILTSWKFF